MVEQITISDLRPGDIFYISYFTPTIKRILLCKSKKYSRASGHVTVCFYSYCIMTKIVDQYWWNGFDTVYRIVKSTL